MRLLVPPVYEAMLPMAAFGGGVAVKNLGGTSSGQGGLKEVERVRTAFPETWLWSNKTVG